MRKYIPRTDVSNLRKHIPRKDVSNLVNIYTPERCLQPTKIYTLERCLQLSENIYPGKMSPTYENVVVEGYNKFAIVQNTQ
jgi:hypothetical protein